MTLSTKHTRRDLLAGIPAVAAAMTTTMTTTAAIEEPESIDAMLKGVDRKTREHIFDVIVGWLNAHDDAKTGAPDPVFAAIKAHKQAMADAQVKAEPVTRVIDPDLDDETALAAACDNERDTLLEFLLTEPTTIAGALAALEYASSPIAPEFHARRPCPVLAEGFINESNEDQCVTRAAADWPAMIARNVRRLIESHAWFNPGLFGPLVVAEAQS